MPGLEELAAVIAQHVNPGKGFAGDPMSMLIFLAGRWAFGSANRFDSAVRSTDLWETLRYSAATVGRYLPERPPTYDQLRHLRAAADDNLGSDLAHEFTAVAVLLAKQVGLLMPEVSARWDRPSPTTVLHGDGSVFAPLSDVTVTLDNDGNTVVTGSRSHKLEKPRVGPTFKGKKGNELLCGLPISVVGCHGRSPWQRVLLGIDFFEDRNEIGSSLRLFERIIEEAAGGVTHVVYDRLMAGTHMRSLMKLGVLPVVPMPGSPIEGNHLKLPTVLQRVGFKSAGSEAKDKKISGKSKLVAPKERLILRYLQMASHETHLGTCNHELHALDGAVISTAPGVTPTLDADYVQCLYIDWEIHADGYHPIGSLRVPCRAESFTVKIDFAGDREGKNRGRDPYAIADWVRPVPEVAEYSAKIEGLRSDIESTFSWLKALLPSNRAGSLKAENFFLDVIGAGLLCNAIAWDVHYALHTKCAQHEAELIRKRVLNSAAKAKKRALAAEAAALRARR
jgi:hypothetical protein